MANIDWNIWQKDIKVLKAYAGAVNSLYNYYMPKKSTKKKVVAEEPIVEVIAAPVKAAPSKDEKYNEFGVCISCQGGNPKCKHNNLTTIGRKIVCTLCGYVARS